MIQYILKKNTAATMLMAAMLLASGCQKEEELNLTTFGETKGQVLVEGLESPADFNIEGKYDEMGQLNFSKDVNRTFVFRIPASPNEVTMYFEPYAKNIPLDKITLDKTEETLKPGFTDVKVMASLTDEGLELLRTTYTEQQYEIGVIAKMKGINVATDTLMSKIVLNKEEYVIDYSINSRIMSFYADRAYVDGKIMSDEPISLTFKVKLSKPASKDLKLKVSTFGMPEAFKQTIKVMPAEIIIPAGELSSPDITWQVSDDFMLTNDKSEEFKFKIFTDFETEETARIEKILTKDTLRLNVLKEVKNIDIVPTRPEGWVAYDKAGWSVDGLNPDNIWYGDISYIIDGDNSSIAYGYPFDYVIDMKQEQKIDGLKVIFYSYPGMAPEEMRISVSTDGQNWESQGKVGFNSGEMEGIVVFYKPATARYIKIEQNDPSYVAVSEFSVFKKE